MVDTQAWGACGFIRVGSSPISRTIRVSLELLKVKFYKEKSLFYKSDFLFIWNFVVKWVCDIYKTEMTKKNKPEKYGNQSEIKWNLFRSKTENNRKSMI